ncbi:MAG: type II toxin-antitoxin system HicA family toxin [Pyrinomonadaceae bacterium]|nr:type II toxin-antitoxin system HicA family toxin [Pyrinomonadaceae bacterium]
MKRRDLLQHLKKHDCSLLREGGSHSIFVNNKTGKRTSIPRHSDIPEFTAAAICRQLMIPLP